MGGYSNPFDQPLTSEVQESAQRQQDSVKASPSGNPFDEPLASEVAEQKHKDAVKADPDAAASNTRQMLVSGLTGMPTPNMTDANKASFASGKAAGSVSVPLVAGGVAGGLASGPILAAIGSHLDTVRKVIKYAEDIGIKGMEYKTARDLYKEFEGSHKK